MIEIRLPADEETIRRVSIGDEVLLSGRIVTARDAVHKYIVENKPAFLHDLLDRSIIYHCGPVVKKTSGGWEIISAGPTTSIRQEPYEAEVIRTYHPAGIMGKGGMGASSLQAMVDCGAAYFHAVGGLAAILADRVCSVESVHMLEEFGSPEALWVLNVEKFPAVVTMDAGGNDLHQQVNDRCRQRLHVR